MKAAPSVSRTRKNRLQRLGAVGALGRDRAALLDPPLLRILPVTAVEEALGHELRPVDAVEAAGIDGDAVRLGARDVEGVHAAMRAERMLRDAGAEGVRLERGLAAQQLEVGRIDAQQQDALLGADRAAALGQAVEVHLGAKPHLAAMASAFSCLKHVHLLIQGPECLEFRPPPTLLRPGPCLPKIHCRKLKFVIEQRSYSLRLNLMNSNRMHQFVRVEFRRFKAFKTFAIDLKHFNVLVGPNNAGKSTILTAFRILAAALRRATTKSADVVPSPNGPVLGHPIEISSISVAEENIFYNYDDSEAATVTFYLSNKNSLTLYFPERGTCYLLSDAEGKRVSSPSTFRTHFNCPIGFVPILGPVDHDEPLYEREAARRALFSYGAARNFRNIWHHYPERFDEFRSVLQQTWPGMDIERPELQRSPGRPLLHMYCPENRIPREIFWSGFGFQVWCQMLTHLIQSKDVSLFLIDEPDIYLHSELQRQLLGLLKNLGPDILIATHSTEIITEADTDDIVLVNKGRRSARRIRDPSQLEEVFKILGSNINPILTQLAKTRRVLFVEGKDFQILGKFARKLGKTGVGNRSDFAVVPIEGFNPERIRNLKSGMETTLGSKIVGAAVLDRDYRSDAECDAVTQSCKQFCEYVMILKRKEIENFLLHHAVLDRAAEQRITERTRRSGVAQPYEPQAAEVLNMFAASMKSHVQSQYMLFRKNFERKHAPTLDEAVVSKSAIEEFDARWSDANGRLNMVPGKDALAEVNKVLQERYKISLTPTAIVDAMRLAEVPEEMQELIQMLTTFSTRHV